MNRSVRRARPGDADVIADLEVAAFPADPWSPVLIEEAIAGLVPTTTFWVAEVDQRLVGYAAVSIVQDVAELQRLATVASERRGGIATALLAAVVGQSADSGAERLLLEVRKDNAAARAFYLRSGFTEIARRAGYYRDGTDAVVLERFVRMTP